MKHNTGASPRFNLKRLGAMSLGLAPLLIGTAAQAATITLPPVSLGAGARTSFINKDVDAPNTDDVSDFNLDSARIYINGSVTDTIKFTFNTEYTGPGRTTTIATSGGADPVTLITDENKVQIMDAIGRFEFSPQLNIWAGRFLPPSDRANLYGPYYANNFVVYNDGITDGYPSVAVGRDTGVAYWGDFDRLKVSFGAFDVPSTSGDSNPATKNDGGDVVLAGRLQIDLWDLEPGYYLNGTYYGDKDILALGVAGQDVGDDSAFTVDFLMEKKIGGGGAFTVEAEYADYEGQAGGYNTAGLPFTESDGYFVLGAFLFPQQLGIGKFQVLGKYADADFDNDGAVSTDFTQQTTELELNYIMKAFNARLSLFYVTTDFDDDAPDVDQIGLGLQIQI